MALAMTPAEITRNRSLRGRLRRRSGSSWGMSLEGSSSGKATKPPRGKARREYSTLRAVNLATGGPNPRANLLTWIPWRVAARKWPDSWTKTIEASTAAASKTDWKFSNVERNSAPARALHVSAFDALWVVGLLVLWRREKEEGGWGYGLGREKETEGVNGWRSIVFFFLRFLSPVRLLVGFLSHGVRAEGRQTKGRLEEDQEGVEKGKQEREREKIK